MSNPVLVEVWRGPAVESRHRGMIAVRGADGEDLLSLGAVDTPVFPRSAIKLFQALPLVESGAADAFGFTDRELALACASHSGEPEHVALAAQMLAKAGLSEASLECGGHWPFDRDVLIALVSSGGAPTALHNNCSGKHAGFLASARHLGFGIGGYAGYDHAIQAEIRAVLADLTGTALSPGICGTDGCSIPTYAVPLSATAHAMAKLAGGHLAPQRAGAARRLMAACMAEPFFVAGTGRFCTRLMQAAPGRIFAKTGAEGVFCAALPEQGIGIAVKCEDGANRAAEAMIAAALARFAGDPPLAGTLSALARRPVKTWNGVAVGDIRPAPALGPA